MKERVKEICERVCEGVDFSSKTLIDDKQLDSIMLMELLSELMEEFDVDIPYKEVKPENFNSVEQIAALIERYQ